MVTSPVSYKLHWLPIIQQVYNYGHFLLQIAMLHDFIGLVHLTKGSF